MKDRTTYRQNMVAAVGIALIAAGLVGAAPGQALADAPGLSPTRNCRNSPPNGCNRPCRCPMTLTRWLITTGSLVRGGPARTGMVPGRELFSGGRFR